MFSELTYYKEHLSPEGDPLYYDQAPTFQHLFDANATDGRLSSDLSLLFSAFADSSLSEYDYLLRMGDFCWNCGASRCAFEAYKRAKKISPLPDEAESRLKAIKKSPFRNKMFVITGNLFRMERAEAFFEIRKRGGLTSDNPINTMDYLVLGSQEWSEMNDGIATRKVQKAAELQKKGRDIKIISEDDFYTMLDETP